MRTIPLIVTLALLASTAAAQETTDRYVLDRTENGWVRMDSETGEITLCRRDGERLSCETNRPDRAAPDDPDRIAAIEKRVETLEKRLAEVGEPGKALPSEQEFDTALGYMRRFFEAFRDMVRDLEAEEKPSGEL